ncbi:UDP-N-acetylmuramoyl-tripeptide--D-alanyl-D-alanine ligase [Pelotomaculum terephthalicicum JT]|uniref:UDP-N-acetylmuramoyl-tripeptide--D-alanyl-D- alanine ligase n=1 Tax=Pelotomaculum TaxID=191373 RepID=UPI0009C6A813|nr:MULTISPECIES: UDP-N-acetylmuramoyl-tripeptide--D-alanyl-D-alanine ligase [Pelotomaculum]MCG9969077.1 UDP-N-acetylmuramoyl-tripeptide--D-alanyl-D-alanine ligase [Pelotomaculum terephthalicicum JT]OPX87403.1 MAG: UDP-N-acetylmuramoyl-tripeptide--D-alanyl-D-alanine ligase [Pelotomaculum sp. PtaB.Bin117]OPY60902.1 MAG: UDP-N-acetylmuramoyl-tripeptide--D-alanyl-D-alanine ligase [Pelotomaculum sp. PtaU1.Bin065]
MKPLSVEQVLHAAGGRLLCGSRDKKFLLVHTDSKKKGNNSLFVPIIGSRVDGHDFIEDAFANGAAGVLTQRHKDDVVGEGVWIAVDNTRKALQDIACYHRGRFNIPVTAVTGSAGKTSTREMIAAALSAEKCVLKTEGNFNSRVGLPLTILMLEDRHEAGVVEIGMSEFGEIAELSLIAKPDIAVVTNIGISHIEQLGSLENIQREKMSITRGMNNNGIVILNGDDPLLAEYKGKMRHKTFFYGLADWCDYRAECVEHGNNSSSFEFVYPEGRQRVYVPAAGRHNVYNALAALSAACQNGIELDAAARGLSAFKGEKMRQQLLESGDLHIIDDTYNASPDSMAAALLVLAGMNGVKRRIAVLADMMELGRFAYQSHFDLGVKAAEYGIDVVLTVGTRAAWIAEGIESVRGCTGVEKYADNKGALESLKKMIKSGDAVLVKGSRSMRTEEIVAGIKDKVMDVCRNGEY